MKIKKSTNLEYCIGMLSVGGYIISFIALFLCAIFGERSYLAMSIALVYLISVAIISKIFFEKDIFRKIVFFIIMVAVIAIPYIIILKVKGLL